MVSRRSFALTLCLLIASTYALAQCNSNDSTAPCFANVSDILGGRQSLIQDDDLVVSQMTVLPFAQSSISLTKNSQVTSSSYSFPQNFYPAVGNSLAIRARLVNTPNDQVVFAAGNAVPPPGHSITVNGMGAVTVPALNVLNAPQSLYGVSGRFLGNGYDQVVFAAAQLNSSVQQIAFQAIGAADPDTPTQGLVAGQLSAPMTNASTLYAMTSGVFTSPQSGQAAPPAQIALLSANPQTGLGLTVSLYSVTPGLGIIPGQVFNLDLGAYNSTKVYALAIAAGPFSGGDHDQIAVAYAVNGQLVQGIILDFASTTGIQKTTFSSAGPNLDTGAYPFAIYLQAARFNWFGASAQLALSSDLGLFGPPPNGFSGKQIFSFDANLKPTAGPLLQQSNGCFFALAAGRFDRLQAVPNTNQTEPNPNLQLADVSTTCSTSSATTLTIYNVDPTTFAISSHATTTILANNSFGPGQQVNSSLVVSMTAADTQGRSLKLLPPEKATVTGHIQPDLVLGLPPMHVDWITAAEGTAPSVFNVSVYPQTFNTSYSFNSSQGSSVSRSGTTSYTAATKETVGAKVSYGIPGIGSVSAQNSEAFGQMHQNVVAHKYNSYAGQSSGFSTKTRFDDVVAASSLQMNIYSYRVVGQCVSAANAPASEGCAAGTKPLYVQFSGPDNVNYLQAAEGRNLEWYQPVQEPGEIFSYPANIYQLQQNVGGGASFEPLTPTDNLWGSQASSAVVANWTNQGGSSVSSGTVSAHSFDSQSSVSASASIFGFSVSARASFGYNSSTSVSTVNQSTSTVSESQGITLDRGIGGSAQHSEVYAYEGNSVIYGQTPPAGVLQSNIIVPVTVQASGHLTAAHAVDPLSTGSYSSGNFWSQAYSVPDLALNHPQRWIQKEPSGINDQEVQFNCPAGFTSSLTSPSCTPNGQSPTPSNVADASFYSMKGLFVTPGDTTNGPQITNTLLGSKVNLRARIYNYSVAPFPAGTQLHVQFYAQPWSDGQFTPQSGNSNAFADAIFIAEGTDALGDSLALVPPFCGGDAGDDPCASQSAPNNWEYAYATWDTSKNNVAGNSTWKFWIVAWAELNGKLVSEVSGHGLQSLPSTPFQSIAAVPVETYSNNLGYYNQVFTVLGPGAPAAGVSPFLTLQNIGLRSGAKAMRDEPVTILATHLSSSQDIHSLLTLYYDGNPDRGGTLFDTQSIDRVPSGDGFIDTARYTPSSCGVHTLYVRSIPLDGSVKAITSHTQLKVGVDAVSAVEELLLYVGKSRLRPEEREDLIFLLQRARTDFEAGNTQQGLRKIKEFRDAICQRGISASAAAAIRQAVEDLEGCLN